MKKALVIITLALCNVFPLWAQTEALDDEWHYEIVGTNLFGVYDHDNDRLVLDTIYTSVEVFDGPMIQVTYTSWNKDGRHGTLPSPMIEYYNENGELVIRSYDALLCEIHPPFTEILNYAQVYQLNDLEAAVTMQEGIAYEAAGMYREAFKKYKQAYRLYPELIVAKEHADAIKGQMKAYQDSVKQVLRWEAYERELHRAEVEAANAAMLASIAQINYQNQQRKAQERKASSSSNTTSQHDAPPASNAKKSSAKSDSSSKKNRPGHQFNMAHRTYSTDNDHSTECNVCRGTGHIRCWNCSGKGYLRKSGIDKYGQLTFRDEKCYTCKGTGVIKCTGCHGSGKIFWW